MTAIGKDTKAERARIMSKTYCVMRQEFWTRRLPEHGGGGQRNQSDTDTMTELLFRR